MQKDLKSLLGLIYLSLITFETEGIKIEVLFSKLKRIYWNLVQIRNT